MTIGSNAEAFAGKAIVDFEPGKPLSEIRNKVYRLSIEYDDSDSIVDRFGAYLEDPNSKETVALVIGAWQNDDSQASSDPIVEAIVSAQKKLPKLKAIFLGDITFEQNEIS